jgi:hypothetical protein
VHCGRVSDIHIHYRCPFDASGLAIFAHWEIDGAGRTCSGEATPLALHQSPCPGAAWEVLRFLLDHHFLPLRYGGANVADS